MRKFFAVVLIAWTTAAMAQVPSGQFSYAFTHTPLWDITGSYTNETPGDIVVLNIQHFADGIITGSGAETVLSDTQEATGVILLKGKVSTSRFQTWVKFTFGEQVNGEINGQNFVGNASNKTLADIDAPTLEIQGLEKTKLCIVGRKCAEQSQAVVSQLPQDMDGTWALETAIAATGNKLSGTGTITLSNGRVLSYQITGSYNPQTQVTKLKMVGEGDAAGTGLSLTAQGAGMALTALKGKVLGQKPTFP